MSRVHEVRDALALLPDARVAADTGVDRLMDDVMGVLGPDFGSHRTSLMRCPRTGFGEFLRRGAGAVPPNLTPRSIAGLVEHLSQVANVPFVLHPTGMGPDRDVNAASLITQSYRWGGGYRLDHMDAMVPSLPSDPHATPHTGPLLEVYAYRPGPVDGYGMSVIDPETAARTLSFGQRVHRPVVPPGE